MVVQKVGEDVTHTFAGIEVEPGGSVVESEEGQLRSYGTSGQLVAFDVLIAWVQSNELDFWQRCLDVNTTCAAGRCPVSSSARV